MFHLTTHVPRRVCIAFSGGVDSSFALDFLSKNHDVSCAFFDHGTEASSRAYDHVQNVCEEKKIDLVFDKITKKKPKDKSWEEFWREERYAFLNSLNFPVVTAHHLDDVVETMIWGFANGSDRIIHIKNNNILRPFLLNTKEDILNWCSQKGVFWLDDSTNDDLSFTRNHIRKCLVPEFFRVNPGFYKIARKKVLAQKDLDKF